MLNVKEIRKKLKLTQNKFANLLDVNIRTVQKWESGETKISGVSLLKIQSELRNVEKEKETVEKEKKTVPYYDLDVTSTITTSFNDVVEKPTFYIDYQPFNDCSAYVNNYGDSMSPKYKNGERLAVKQIFNLEVLLFGETYLIITNENANNLKTVKEVHPHEDNSKLILRAANPEYKGDTVINKVDILSMFAVKGCISQNFN